MRFAIFIGLLVISSSESVLAGTVINATFDTSITGCSSAAATAEWSSLDSSRFPGSGSLKLTSSGSDFFATSQCITLTPPVSNYVAGAKVFMPKIISLDDVTFEFYFFPSSNCTGPGSFGAIAAFPGLEAGVWNQTLFSDIAPNPNVESVLVYLHLDNPQATAYFDDVLVGTDVAAALDGGRFSVGIAWKTSTGQIGLGSAVNLTTESAYFTFFDPSNVELIVKVLNGCTFNNSYWVFAGGLTNVETYLTVDDRVGLRDRDYQNPQGKAFLPLQDTAAFQTCP